MENGKKEKSDIDPAKILVRRLRAENKFLRAALNETVKKYYDLLQVTKDRRPK